LSPPVLLKINGIVVLLKQRLAYIHCRLRKLRRYDRNIWSIKWS